jgi:hypothetical protein
MGSMFAYFRKIVTTIILIFILVSGNLYAQQNHFVYIQSDAKQAFTVKINEQVFTASSIGYVIIPKLVDGEYKATISFPNNQFPDQQFVFTVSNNDIGYSLKNYGQKGWGLFNLQSLDVTLAIQNINTTTPVKEATANNNGFGDMLADVVSDPNIQAPVIVPSIAEKENKPAAGVEKIDTVAAPLAIADSLKNTNPMVKYSERYADSGVAIVFLDTINHKTDTISIFLPDVKPIIPNSVNQPADSSKTIIQETPTILADTLDINETVEPDTAGIKNPFYNKTTSADTIAATVSTKVPKDTVVQNVEKTEAIVPVINAVNVAGNAVNCTKTFTDADTDKLRKKMFAVTGDDKMIELARKYFTGKCVTVAQLKTLSGSFLSDEARYNFFSAAYAFADDKLAFASLENQLIDPLYKNRFKALLK